MTDRRIEQHELIRWAGLFTWACVAIPLVMMPFYYGEQLDLWSYSIWVAAQVAFGAAYWTLARSLGQAALGRGLVVALLLVMTGAALVVSHASESGLGGILVLIVSGLLPWVLPTHAGIWWLVGMNLGLSAVFATMPDSSLLSALLYCALYLGYSSFTFVLSLVARREADSRFELRQLNSELRATRELLAESSRIAERVRIARDLHDVVGHHLTALSLNLETASHLAEGKAKEHVDRSQSLARLLLSDVREVVGQMRQQDDELNLSQAIERLAEGLPSPRVHLDMPAHFAVKDPQRAQVIMRCVQEIITNAVRHARARNLWIRFEEGPDGLTLSARDDGRGADDAAAGHGLTGMRERLKQFGGRLKWESESGRGFRLEAWLPQEAT